MILHLCRGGTGGGVTVGLGGSCSSRAIVPSSVLIAQMQASSLPPDTFQHVHTTPHSICSSDTLGSYHLGVPEISLCLQYQELVLRPRLGRAEGDRAMCGGRRTSQPSRIGDGTESSDLCSILVLVGGEPRIWFDFLFPTSFSRLQRKDRLVQVGTCLTRLAPPRHPLQSSAWRRDHICSSIVLSC